MAFFNYLTILRILNTTILFINVPTECEICFIAEENFVREIAVHRLLDVGVDLNAKYAIMCRKTVLISENDEESTHSCLRQHFDLQ